MSKVNIRTGRKGYHRRVQATEKAVEERAEVYDGFSNIGENAAEKHFSLAVKEVLATKETNFDVSQLMFFQSSMMTSPMLGNNPDVPNATKAIGDAHSNVKNEPGALNIDSSGDEHEPTSSRPTNSLDQIAFALPKAKVASLAKAQAKAQAKAAQAKPKAQPKGKAKGGAKRKTGDGEGDESDVQIHILQPNAKQLKSDMDANDRSIADEYEKQLAAARQDRFKRVIDGDQETQDGLREGMKPLSSLHSELKKKIKSLGRRKGEEKQPWLLTKLEELDSEVQEVMATIGGLIAFSGDDDDHITSLMKYAPMGWAFSPAVYKVAFKCAMTSQLQFQRWQKMTSTTRQLMLDVLGLEVGKLGLIII